MIRINPDRSADTALVMYVHTFVICYLVIKGIIMSLYKRTTYRMCCMSSDRKYMFGGLFKPRDTQDDNNMYVLS